MMAWKRLAFVTLTAASLAAPARAQGDPQSLAETARKAKQNPASKPVRLYTNDDVNRLKPGGISILGVALGPEETAEAERLSQEDRAERDRTEAEWRARFADLRKAISSAEDEIQELRREYVREDWTANGPYLGPRFRQDQWWISPRMRELEEMILRSERALIEMKLQLVDLEDDLRRAGGYPGWAR